MHSNPRGFRAIALVALAAFAAATAAQDAGPSSAGPSVPNPLAQEVANQFAASCREMNAASMADSIRDDVGPDASPALIAEMVAVGEQGVCECFVGALRAEPDDRVRGGSIDHMEPQFKVCMAAALKPRMARICSEAQRIGTDDSAPDCACLAEAVAKMDENALGDGANDLFDVLNSTRDIPGTAGALGDAARSCATPR